MPNNGHVPFSPSVSLDTDSSTPEVLNSVIESPERRSMMPGMKPARPEGSREIVSIREIMPETKNKETPGVDIKKSPQAEILKPGGMFDQYVEEKKKEFRERMAQEDAKREIEATASQEASENSTEVDTDEVEILSSIVDNNPVNVEVKGVSRDEEVEKEKENNEVPFYQAAKENGFIDDYEYPDQYNDLPTDDEEEKNNIALSEISGEMMDNVELKDESNVNYMVDDVEGPTEEKRLIDYPEMQGRPVGEAMMEARVHVMNEMNKNGRVYQSDAVQEDIDGKFVSDSCVVESDDRTISSEKIKFVYTDNQSVEDVEKELENDQGVPTDDERLEELRAQISEKIKPKAKAMSLEGWTIANKATSSNKILEKTTAAAGKWVLPATGICIQMREVSGQKIEYMRENMGDNATAARNRLKVLYDHIVTPKPQSFEAWCKSIAFADYDHLFMPLYLAAFSGSNYMPQTCVIEKGKIPKVSTGCGKMFLSDDMNIMKCVKFTSDETKTLFWDLYDSDRTNSAGLFASEVMPISHDFAIAFQEPTLYSVLLESAVYGADFRKKYDNVISIMPYISEIYWLDHKNQKLVRVSYTEYANNAAKTAKSKAIRYSKIFDTFSTDEYTNVISIINSINEKYDWLTYQIPEMTCPECKRVIPAEEITAAGLVFTRHRLGILANTSIN